MFCHHTPTKNISENRNETPKEVDQDFSYIKLSVKNL